MDGPPQPIIKTGYKTETGSRLSWPIGAEQISAGLSGVPQFADLEITFSTPSPAGQTWSWQIVFTARYRKRTKSVFESPTAFGKLMMKRWSLSVSAVPRADRRRVNEMLILQLPEVAAWLANNARRDAFGSIAIHLVWNKEKDVVYASTEGSPETERAGSFNRVPKR